MKIRKEVNNMSDFEVIATYTQDQAIEDGILVKLCEIRWNGTIKPYIALRNSMEWNDKAVHSNNTYLRGYRS
jgi:hypothetical protein